MGGLWKDKPALNVPAQGPWEVEAGGRGATRKKLGALSPTSQVRQELRPA